MITPHLLNDFGVILYKGIIVFSLVGSLIFPIWYGFTRPWSKTDMGRHLMAYSCWSALTMCLVAIRPLFGSDPVSASPLGMLLVLLLGFLGWWRAWLFYKHRKD